MARWDHRRCCRTARFAVLPDMVLAALALAASAEPLPAPLPATNASSRPATSLPAGPHVTTSPDVPLKHTVPPLPPEYEVLMKRSFFAHWRGQGSGGPEGATPQPPPAPAIVLRGVADQGGQRTALLEDLANGKTRQLHIGDETPAGRVVAITMDGLDRTLGGKISHVVVGQPLAGALDAPGPATRQIIAREDRPPMPPQAPPGEAIPAGAKIIEIKQ